MQNQEKPKRWTPDDVEIGARIKFLRKEHGMSQTTLGNKLGVTFQQVQKYEKGVNRIAASRLKRIAEIFATTTDKLTGTAPGPGASAEAFDLLASFAKDHDALAMSRAFRSIRRREVRQQILQLTRLLAGDDVLEHVEQLEAV